MMLLKITAVVFSVFLTIAPSVFPYDTLKVDATLDTIQKIINGTITIPVPVNMASNTFELELPPNRYAPDYSGSFENPAGLNKAGFYGSISIDSIFLDGIDILSQFRVNKTRGILNLGKPTTAGQKLRIRFRTHMPEYGTALLASYGEYFLSGWFPYPAVHDGRTWRQPDYSQFAVPESDYYIYIVSLTAPENLIIAAPSPPIESTALEGKTARSYIFGPASDFAVALSPNYMVDSSQHSDVTFKIYYRDYESKVEPDLMNIVRFTFDYMNENVGPFVYTELNVALINAVRQVELDYPGMIVLFSPRGGALLSNYYEYLVMRGVVNQWFKAMIVSDRNKEPWLDISISEYFAQKIARKYWGDNANLISLGGFEATFTDDQRLSALATEGKNPVNSQADQFASEAECTSTFYDRGAMTVATIFNLLGDSLESVFWKEYYTDNLFHRISTVSFLALLNDVGGPDLEKLAEYLLTTCENLDFAVSDLSYHKVDSITYESEFVLSRTGTTLIPVEYDVILYNEDTLSYIWDSDKYSERIKIKSEYPVKSVFVDPDNKISADINLFNNSVSIATDSRPTARLTSGIMFIIESIFSLVGGW